MNTDQSTSPLEKVFGIEAGSSLPFKFAPEDDMQNINERSKSLLDPTTGEIMERQVNANGGELEKEERIEDLHIDGQLEGIHSSAINAFESQSRMANEVDPKFAARNAEVAAQYLNIALNAVNSRVDAKFKRQKIRMAKAEAGTPKNINNNVFLADRNDVLRALFSNQEKDITPAAKVVAAVAPTTP